MVYNGFISNKVVLSDSLMLLIGKQLHNNIYNHVCFTAYGKVVETIDLYDIDKKDLVRISYHIKSKKINDYWTTSLIIDTIELKEKASPQMKINI